MSKVMYAVQSVIEHRLLSLKVGWNGTAPDATFSIVRIPEK